MILLIIVYVFPWLSSDDNDCVSYVNTVDITPPQGLQIQSCYYNLGRLMSLHWQNKWGCVFAMKRRYFPKIFKFFGWISQKNLRKEKWNQLVGFLHVHDVDSLSSIQSDFPCPLSLMHSHLVSLWHVCTTCFYCTCIFKRDSWTQPLDIEDQQMVLWSLEPKHHFRIAPCLKWTFETLFKLVFGIIFETLFFSHCISQNYI